MTTEPAGKARCPNCGVLLLTMELLAVHLMMVKACRDDLVEADRIQQLSEHDPLKRTILTDGMHLTIQRRTKWRNCKVVLKGVTVLGELVDVSVWSELWKGRRELRKRQAQNA